MTEPRIAIIQANTAGDLAGGIGQFMTQNPTAKISTVTTSAFIDTSNKEVYTLVIFYTGEEPYIANAN